MENDLAYAAGLIDGEGCIGTYWNRVTKNYQLRVTVEMCQREGLDLLANLFEGKWYYKEKKTPRRGIYVWMVFGSSAEKCLKQLHPYLRVKKEHAETVLMGDWSGCKGKSLPEEEILIRDYINTKIKKLNERGSY